MIRARRKMTIMIKTQLMLLPSKEELEYVKSVRV